MGGQLHERLPESRVWSLSICPVDLTALRTWFKYYLLNEQIRSDNFYFRVHGFDMNCNRMALVTLSIDSTLAEASKAQGGKIFRKHSKARLWTICSETRKKSSSSKPFVCISWSCTSSLNKYCGSRDLRRKVLWQRVGLRLPIKQKQGCSPLRCSRKQYSFQRLSQKARCESPQVRRTQ